MLHQKILLLYEMSWKKFTLAQAELTMIPQTTIDLNEEQREQLERLVDKLEDDDDVSEVFTAAEM